MEYNGKYQVFDTSRIRTYPLAGRLSKVLESHLSKPGELAAREPVMRTPELEALVKVVIEARAAGRPVIWMTGAHNIKNGFGPLMRDLAERGLVTLIGMNMAGMIHDLELALVGQTSEDVRRALPKGEFGFAEETGGLINMALIHGEKLGVGAGEALGRLICGEPFPQALEFPHKDLSVIAGGWLAGVPVTMHAGIGTDIIDQHPAWDASAKGGCSGRDFLVFCAEVERLHEGGVYLNIGTSVTGPEVFLKACSMAANVGHAPKGITTASFDIRPADPRDADNERAAGYYCRDLKSVVVRIPEAFGGHGYYIQGDHLKTVPAFYQLLVQASQS
ncbi:hypothetical protein LLG95_05200 [bacterium]|nr:hypothetical protein [bacterium]